MNVGLDELEAFTVLMLHFALLLLVWLLFCLGGEHASTRLFSLWGIVCFLLAKH